MNFVVTFNTRSSREATVGMLVDLAQHVVRATDQQFEAWHASPQVFSQGFALDRELSVGFDTSQGGAMRAAAVLPVSGRPFFRLTPVDMGASRWLTLERDLDVAALRDIGQLVPVLDAAAVRSVSLFVLLRVTLNNNKFADTSSAQIELRREPRARSLPVSLDDLPVDALANAKSAKVIFFVEGRDVDIDVYGLEILGVPQPDQESGLDAAATLRERALAGASNVIRKTFDTATVQATGRLDGFREFGDGVNVDIDSNGGQYATYRPKKDLVLFDYARAARSRWRTFEFRFADVEVSSTLTALISMDGSAKSDAPWASIPILVRRYKSEGWDDSDPAATLEVEAQAAHSVAMVDLQPLLLDDKDVQTFGLVLFVPKSCRSLQFSTFEAILYDRGVDSPGPVIGTGPSSTHHRLRSVARRAAAARRSLRPR